MNRLKADSKYSKVFECWDFAGELNVRHRADSPVFRAYASSVTPAPSNAHNTFSRVTLAKQLGNIERRMRESFL
jgi:hypothetical protein